MYGKSVKVKGGGEISQRLSRYKITAESSPALPNTFPQVTPYIYKLVRFPDETRRRCAYTRCIIRRLTVGITSRYGGKCLWLEGY